MLEYIKAAIRELFEYAQALACYAVMLAFSFMVFYFWWDYLSGVFK